MGIHRYIITFVLITDIPTTLNRILHSYSHQVFLLLLAWLIALVFSMEFLLSISMIGMVLLALFEIRSAKLGLRASAMTNAKGFIKDKSWWLLTVPFFLVVFTAWYSTEDGSYLLERLRIKLPYLILPFAFYSVPQWNRNLYQHFIYLFLCTMTLTSVGVLGHYIMNFESINVLISQGQSIPTPTNHIRFSLMVSLAILLGFSLFRRAHFLIWKWEKWLILGMGIFLLIFLHILSVRSGLAVFYLSFGLLIIRHIIISKQYLIGGLVLVMLVSLPIGAYYAIPSFKGKISYMMWDLKMHAEGKGESYSDSERLSSLHTASVIIREHPVMGVGAGDLKYQMHQHYDQLYPELGEQSRKMPHNQLISIWAGTGIIGLLLFLIAGMYPLLDKKRFLDPHFLSINLIIFLSFMVENTIENAVGIGFHLLFLLIGMNALKHSEKEQGVS